VAHDPERAKEQTERRREKLTALTEFGDALAAKLDAQDAGSNERGRRASDRGAYTRFSREVFDAHFSRFITPELESKRFAFSVNEEAVEKAEGLGLPFTHNPQYHNKRSSIVYQGVADTHVLHGGIALPE
jgi:hypothetical protein